LCGEKKVAAAMIGCARATQRSRRLTARGDACHAREHAGAVPAGGSRTWDGGRAPQGSFARGQPATAASLEWAMVSRAHLPSGAALPTMALAWQTANNEAAHPTQEEAMNRKFAGRPYVLARAALLLYLAYVAGCAWAWLFAVPSRAWQDLLLFLLEIASGLPWTLPLLALPAILGQLDPRASGQGFFTLVHLLAALGVGINLAVLYRLCELDRILHVRPFQATL
jgi:hypothetical protein